MGQLRWFERLAGWITRRFPHRVRVIPDRDDESRPYLTRIYLLGGPEASWPGWAPVVALHIFHMSDTDKHLHSHPWRWFWSRRLSGGYFETTPSGTYFRRPGSSAVMWNDSPHRVTLAGDWCRCWTLVVMGPRAKGWGFYVDGRLVDHDTYLDAKRKARGLLTNTKVGCTV